MGPTPQRELYARRVFVAHHEDGPLAGRANDVGISARHVPRELQYAPAPAGMPAVTKAGYILVGVDGTPLGGPHADVITYMLDRTASQLHPARDPDYAAAGMEEGTAVYRQLP